MNRRKLEDEHEETQVLDSGVESDRDTEATAVLDEEYLRMLATDAPQPKSAKKRRH